MIVRAKGHVPRGKGTIQWEEVRNQRSEVRSQRSEVRGQRSDSGRRSQVPGFKSHVDNRWLGSEGRPPEIPEAINREIGQLIIGDLKLVPNWRLGFVSSFGFGISDFDRWPRDLDKSRAVARV